TLLASTDGSCVPNPGKGAAAYYIPAQTSNIFHEHSGPYAFHRPVTITETEITAIHLFLNKILTDKVYDQILRVKIYVDNKPILQFISGETYPKYNNIKIMIQNIFIKLLQIQHTLPHCHIAFKKIKSHSDITINDAVDKIANDAANNTIIYDTFAKYIPYQTTITQIHKQCYKQWSNKWENRPRSNTNRLMMAKNPKLSKKIYKLIKYMNCSQMGVIMRLMTGHIELNEYCFHIGIKDSDDEVPNRPECEQCSTNENEDVEHFILRCPKYDLARMRLINDLDDIWDGFENGTNVDLGSILFPYTIKMDDTNRDMELNNQVKCWKALLRYVHRTGRFSSLYRIDKDKLLE
ncbi:MAG: hypothetical protein GY928_22740, partial [Colwellia sp.]|nr:hypothetical protein [Colwellia sp.]